MSVSELVALLNYHVVNGTSTANGSQPFVGYQSNLADGMTMKTTQGRNVTITEADNSVFINSARVLQPDILLSNGVLHVIDNVLDYNATGVRPNPALASQQPVIQGSGLGGDVVPFTGYFPTSVTKVSASEAMPTGQGQATETSFGLGDIGNGAIGKSSVSDGSLNVRATGSAAGNMSASASASRTSGAPLMTVMSAEAKGLEASGALLIGVILLAFVVL